MRETAIARLCEYQQHVTAAYEALRRGDNECYTKGLYSANRAAAKARAELGRREYALFQRAAARSVDVLRKCTALGLRNIEKRLAEYRLVESLALMLGAGSVVRRREAAAESNWLIAA